jgi:hypothetical protein
MYGATPDAIIATARYVEREYEGAGFRYRMEMLDAGPTGSALFEVRSNDGARFYIWSDRLGSVVVEGDTTDALLVKVQAMKETA